MQNFKTLRQSLLGELAMSPEEREKERKKKEKKMPFIVATYVYASSQGQRTHSARTNNLMESRHKNCKDLMLLCRGITIRETNVKSGHFLSAHFTDVRKRYQRGIENSIKWY
jgi:hypothetical protein